METAKPSTCEAVNSLPWRRKYWHPWGKTIGFHDETCIRINGRLFVLHRFWEGDETKFYVPQGFSAKGQYGYEPCIRFFRLDEAVEFLTERSLLPEDTPTYIENPPPCSQQPGLIYVPSMSLAG